MISWGGKIAVELFVIISGYFLISSKFKIRKLLKLWFEVFCYSVIPVVIYNIIQGKEFTFDSFYKYLYPVSSNIFWFVTSYIQLYLLSPFIVKMIKSIKKDTIKKMLIMITLIFIVMRTILYKPNIFEFGNIFGFIYFFCIGAYIKLYGIEFLEKNRKRNIILLLIILVTYFTMRMVLIKIIEPMEIPKLGYIIDVNLLDYNLNSIFAISISILSFYIFKNIKLKKHKTINFFASTSLAVYLLHENPIVRQVIWNQLFSIKFVHVTNLNELWTSTNIINSILATPTVFLGTIIGISNEKLIIFHVIMVVIFIYILSTIIEFLRKNIIEEPIFKLLDKSKRINTLFNKVDMWMND